MRARTFVPVLFVTLLALMHARGDQAGAKVSSVASVSKVANGEVALDDESAQRGSCGMLEGMCRVLEQHDELWGEPIEALTPRIARQMPTLADAVRALISAEGRSIEPTSIIPGIGSTDRKLKVGAGLLPARIYTPSGAGPFPIVVYFHGGGFVLADRNAYDLGARGLAERAKAIVVSVDYRLAPERRFPAAHEDAIAAYRWVIANATKLNGDSTRVALAGEDAGGNLALATAIAADDAKLPRPLHVLAVYPIVGTDTTTASYQEHASAQPLNRAMMTWALRQLVVKPGQLDDPRLNLLSADLSKLPPVTIVAAEVDPLRSEGEVLAERLRSAGIDVARRQWDGVAHDFFGLGPVLLEARQAQGFAGARLRASFAAR